MRTKVRLYTTEDGRVVEEGDPEARFVWAAPGALVDDEIARKHGLGEFKRKPKAKAKQGDKAVRSASDKSRKKGGDK